METDNKKILLVEDDQNFGAILKDYLMLNDFDVTLAKNGMEGFEKFKKDTYDLCILDVMMPYKDGYTLAKEIREKNKEVPIVFLTAKSMKEDVLKGYKVGADDYLNKPFDAEVLLLVLYENDLMPRELALTKIWRDDNYFTSRSMDVYIAKLRKYLKPDANVEILNIHGEGFRLVIKNKVSDK